MRNLWSRSVDLGMPGNLPVHPSPGRPRQRALTDPPRPPRPGCRLGRKAPLLAAEANLALCRFAASRSAAGPHDRRGGSEAACGGPAALLKTLEGIPKDINANVESVSILSYNRSTLLVRLGRLADAAAALAEVFETREALSPTLAQRVALALAKVSLSLGRPDQVDRALGFLSSEKVLARLYPSRPQTTPSPLPPLPRGPFLFDTELIRAQLAILRRQASRALQSAHVALDIHRQERLRGGRQRLSVLLAQARALFLSRDYEGAVRLVVDSKLTVLTVSADNGTRACGLRTAALNVLGCAHFRMGKPGLAGVYFRRALNEASEIPPNLTFNLAMHLYATREYPAAVLRFRQACAAGFALSPILWIRLAECLIAQIDAPTRQKSEKSLVQSEYLRGDGALVCIVRGGAGSVVERKQSGGHIADSQLEEALQCLRNAACLLIQRKRARRRLPGASGTPTPSVPESERAQAAYESLLIEGVYIKMVYVSLSLGNPHSAIKYGRKAAGLRKFGKTEPRHMFYLNCFMAEAWCALSRPAEALNALNCVKEDHFVASARPDGGQGAMREEEFQSATAKRCAIFVNLANAHIMKGNVKQSNECADRALKAEPECLSAVRLKVYLAIKAGRVETAMGLLRRFRRGGWG